MVRVVFVCPECGCCLAQWKSFKRHLKAKHSGSAHRQYTAAEKLRYARVDDGSGGDPRSWPPASWEQLQASPGADVREKPASAARRARAGAAVPARIRSKWPKASSDEQEMVPHLASALLSILELMPRPQQRLLDGCADRLSIQESKLIMQQGVERLKQYNSMRSATWSYGRFNQYCVRCGSRMFGPTLADNSILGTKGHCSSCMKGLPVGDDTHGRMLCVSQTFVIGSCIRFLERCLKAQLCLPVMEPIAQAAAKAPTMEGTGLRQAVGLRSVLSYYGGRSGALEHHQSRARDGGPPPPHEEDADVAQYLVEGVSSGEINAHVNCPRALLESRLDLAEVRRVVAQLCDSTSIKLFVTAAHQVSLAEPRVTVMMGREGCRTKVEVARTHLSSLAVPLDCSMPLAVGEDAASQQSAAAVPGSEEVALACWCLVPPCMLEEAAAHAASVGKAFDGDGAAFTRAEMEAFQRNMGGEDAGVLLIEQRAGEVVTVQPGWAHTVINERACARFAWGWYDPPSLQLCVMVAKDMTAFISKNELAAGRDVQCLVPMATQELQLTSCR